MTTAKTRCLFMVGHPIAQTHTPAVINRWCEKANHDVIMIGANIEQQSINALFDTMRGWENCIGCTVTMPYKQIAFEACDVLTDRAARLGAVNTIQRMSDGRLYGEMTDGLALIGALQKNKVETAEKTVLLAGAGGSAGSAIADALCSRKIARLIVIEPDQARRKTVFAILRHHHEAVAIELPDNNHGPVDIAINATPLGMDEADELPLNLDWLRSGSMVADVITRPERTKMLRQADDKGFKTQSGVEMATAQLDFQCAHWGLA